MVAQRILTAISRTQLSTVIRAAFWTASFAVLWSTLTDTDSITHGLWDKALHFSAFYVLAAIGAVAWPNLQLRWIGLGLLGFGLGIEALQKLPFIARDASWADFLADGLGVGCALVPVALDRLRRHLA